MTTTAFCDFFYGINAHNEEHDVELGHHMWIQPSFPYEYCGFQSSVISEKTKLQRISTLSIIVFNNIQITVGTDKRNKLAFVKFLITSLPTEQLQAKVHRRSNTYG
ncbi:hypothetical protein CLF_103210 [Clonorchis sinensis]|uniref:Uncharacterized protein n=1 Tax=Clonorchis sinensis TaxID=79923 RepID=G7Y9A1_CLOSI|nr:hypothetical protein CLF_103210 [Clonorchis sinensis]